MSDSADAEDLFDRVCRAIDDGDVGYWRDVISPEAMVVGSAPDEVYRGREEVVAAFESYGAIPCVAGDRVWRVRSETLWCYGDVSIAGVDARLSIVAYRHEGRWRIEHWHVSIAVPDEEAFPDVAPREAR